MVGLASMHHPLTSLFLGVLLFILGGLLLCPDSGVRVVRGPDGQVLRRPNGRPMMAQDWHKDLLANWPAYLCFLAGAAAFAWTAFLVVYGTVACVRGIAQPAASPNSGPTTPSRASGVGEGPPSVS